VYGGKISDDSICKCGFYQELDRRKTAADAPSNIYADKGFIIFIELSSHDSSLTIPTSASKNQKFVEDDLITTKKVAKLRIFSEHAMRGLKKFKIFQRVYPIGMIDLLDGLVLIAGLHQNLTAKPIVPKGSMKVYPDNPCPHEIVFGDQCKFVPYSPDSVMSSPEEDLIDLSD
jgi:hypothetical protein